MLRIPLEGWDHSQGLEMEPAPVDWTAFPALFIFQTANSPPADPGRLSWTPRKTPQNCREGTSRGAGTDSGSRPARATGLGSPAHGKEGRP